MVWYGYCTVDVPKNLSHENFTDSQERPTLALVFLFSHSFSPLWRFLPRE